MMSNRSPMLSRRGLLAVAPALAVPQARAQTAGAPVRIGVLADMSGPYADNTGPGLVLAAQMAVEDFGGQVLGRPVRVEFADDQNKPDVGLGIAAAGWPRTGSRPSSGAPHRPSPSPCPTWRVRAGASC